MEGDGMSKAEIDTTAPFRSVKEAVMMFGDRVLATEVYATSLKQMQNGTMIDEDYDKLEEARSEEVEEAKQSLRRAREESVQMATSLFFLKQELQQTKTELHQLKLLHHSAPNQFQNKKYVTFTDPPCVERVVRPDPQASVQLPRQASLKKRMKQVIPLIKRIFLRKRESSEVAFA